MKRARRVGPLAMQARLESTIEGMQQASEEAICECGKLCTCGAREFSDIENIPNSPQTLFCRRDAGRRHTDYGGLRKAWGALSTTSSGLQPNLQCDETLPEADTPDSTCDDTDGFFIARRKGHGICRPRTRHMSLFHDQEEVRLYTTPAAKCLDAFA
eukprot:scaffold345214_cov46-Prasinocladus_malaysianus.AAC.1